MVCVGDDGWDGVVILFPPPPSSFSSISFLLPDRGVLGVWLNTPYRLEVAVVSTDNGSLLKVGKSRNRFDGMGADGTAGFDDGAGAELAGVVLEAKAFGSRRI